MIMTWMDRDSEAKQGSMQIIRKVDDDFFFICYMLNALIVQINLVSL